MRIHREGRAILLAASVFLLSIHSVVLFRYGATAHRYYASFTAVSVLLYAWLIYFFRNPYRVISQREAYVLAPADGTVVAIQEVYEDEYLRDNRVQISVFMSPFNVHVNRNPISGIVKFFKYHPGRYLVAWHPKSSTKNERTTIVVEHAQGVQVLFRQIAGFIARRIKSYVREGDRVQQGSECGFIKFGSRVDVFLPLDAKLRVSLGQKVKGGSSVLAEL
ncbi:MAG: phosphatidylserine decarboxylase family protein [Amoebophilaceae bacterium]|jgi:phosphatidylserine decarboxylase|nr:phosphatidylserine decarboxylase family protein [Amoebophilaceae bacterium]